MAITRLEPAEIAKWVVQVEKKLEPPLNKAMCELVTANARLSRVRGLQIPGEVEETTIRN